MKIYSFSGRYRFAILFFLAFFSYVGVFAQYKGQYRIQSGSEYNFSAGLFGINFTGEYFPLENISVSPSFTFLLPATGKASNTHVDVRYYFTEEEVEFYSFLGYSLYRRRLEFDPVNPFRNHNTLSIGGGVLYKLVDELGINGEIRYQPQNSNEFIIRIGISYFIN